MLGRLNHDALLAVTGKVPDSLSNRLGIAIAMRTYKAYRALLNEPRWQRALNYGARPQRLLWASTGAENPAYSDVLYVEELVGADTVNTMPPATMDAFRSHGKARASLTENIGEAERVMAALARCGISIDAVMQKLVEKGVQLFADAFDTLLGAVSRKRAAAPASRCASSAPSCVRASPRACSRTSPSDRRRRSRHAVCWPGWPYPVREW